MPSGWGPLTPVPRPRRSRRSGGGDLQIGLPQTDLSHAASSSCAVGVGPTRRPAFLGPGQPRRCPAPLAGLAPRPAADDQQRHRSAQQGDGDLGGEDDVQCPAGTRRSLPYCLLRWSFLQSFHQTLRHRTAPCWTVRPVQGVEADECAGRVEEPEQDVRAPLVADLQAPVADQPRQRPLHHVPVAAQPLARLDAAPGDPGRDAAPAQRQTAARVVVPLVAMQLGRALARPPRPPSRALDRGTASTIGSSSIESWVLAADSPAARGMPRRSTSRWYLESGLPRSVGFEPVRQPPVWRARSSCPGWPATSRAGPGGRDGPAARGGAATRRRAASRAAAASR